jgi:hypothetical protein
LIGRGIPGNKVDPGTPVILTDIGVWLETRISMTWRRKGIRNFVPKICLKEYGDRAVWRSRPNEVLQRMGKGKSHVEGQ